MNLVLWMLPNAFQRHINFDMLFVIKERIFGQRIKVQFLFLFLNDRLDAFKEDEHIGIIFFDNLANLQVLIERFGSRCQFVLRIVDHFSELIGKDGGAFFKSETFFDIDQMSF